MRRSIRYSQNFLRNQKLIVRLVSGSSLSMSDTVLDIGAGNGSITRELAVRCARVIAYEADSRLTEDLRALFRGANVDVITGDFLNATLPTKAYKVFANPPFNRTSDIVRKLLDAARQPEDAYLIMQREAAHKFMGEPSHHSLFAILHEPWFAVDITHTFHREDFIPQPSVATVLLHIHRREQPLVARESAATFRDLVSYVYNHANPNILPALQKLFAGRTFQHVETALGPRVTAKPSRLNLEDWLMLVQLFQVHASQQHLITGTAVKLQVESGKIEKHHRTRADKNWRHAS